MHSYTVFLALVALSTAVPLSTGPFCNCGLGDGEDVCQDKQCAPLVVRPLDLPRPPPVAAKRVVCKELGGVPSLKPIGGPCSYQHTLVKPASVPKPQCTTCSGSIGYSQQQFAANRQNRVSSEWSTRPVYVDEVIEDDSNPANLVPADPVSLAAAYNALRESACDAHITEDKLNFGFRKLPKDVPVYVKKTNNINENLYSLNGDVVELKRVSPCSSKTLAEEAAEGLLELVEDEEEDDFAQDEIKRLSLGELGYAPATIKKTKFVTVDDANSEEEAVEEAIEEAECNDGFKYGNLYRKEVPHLERPVLVQHGQEQVRSCGCNGPCGCTGTYNYETSSSSASSSSNNQQSQRIVLETVSF